MPVRLYVLQRLSAALLAPLVIVHVGVIFYASARGLSAVDILGRTRGSVGWALYYGLFVALASVHASIGLRVVLSEWTGLSHRALDITMWGAGALLAGLGLRAVAAVTLP
jgi:fumarate reductase subunit C